MLLEVSPEHQIPGVHFCHVNAVSMTHVGDRFLLVVVCNGGTNPMFEFLPLGNDSFKVTYFDSAKCPYNCNNVAFGTGNYSRFMCAGSDRVPFPLVFEIDEDSRLKYLENKKVELSAVNSLTSPEDYSARYDSVMTAWWGETSVVAMGLDQGHCVVFDFDSNKIIAILSNKDKTHSTASQCGIRTVAFSSKYPILIFAESRKYLHIVDMRTWKQQILEPPRLEPGDNRFDNADINGISWVPDQRILYVAYGHCIQEYFLSYGMPSLLDLCVDKLVTLRERWEEFGWKASAMPWQVSERLI
jgi:hypothetical protein